MLTIDDFIATYSDPDDRLNNNIQQIVNHKKEFLELRTEPREARPSAPGQAYKHQLTVERLVSVWLNEILLLHEPGTGKTCSFSRVAEKVKFIHGLYDSSIDGAIVLVKGSTLKEEFKKQILCECTPGTYITQSIRETEDMSDLEDASKKRRAAINKSIKSWYTVLTYGEFVGKFAKPVTEPYTTRNKKVKNRIVRGKINELMTDEEITRHFSNKIFFIDEGHNLRTLQTSPIKNTYLAEETEKELSQGIAGSPDSAKVPENVVSGDIAQEEDIAAESESEQDRSVAQESLEETDGPDDDNDDLHIGGVQELEADADTREELGLGIEEQKKISEADFNKFIYTQIHRVFHLIVRSKKVVATATPMINEVSEIGELLNLLLPMNNQIPDDFPYQTATVDDLYKYCNGYISYVRTFETGAIPVYLGEPLKTDMIVEGAEKKSKKIEYKTYTVTNENNERVFVESQNNIVTSEMKYRKNSSGKLVGQLIKYRDLLETEKSAKFYIARRQASIFVFPDQSIGNRGFNKYCKPIIEKTDDYTMENELKRELYVYKKDKKTLDVDRSIENISIWSCKFAADIQAVIDNPTKKFYIYTEFIKIGAI